MATDTSPLAIYRSKRRAERTPEPMGGRRPGPRRSAHSPVFVVQEHHARSLHWDFRLEHDGVLVSWALPKGVPDDPHTNHLAVPTEDHPLEYSAFEGDIPAGEYGAGRVAIWDLGTYELENWSEREVKVVLHGSRLSGRYVLFAAGRDTADHTGRGGTSQWVIHRMEPTTDHQPTSMPKTLEPMLAVPGQLPAADDEGRWAFEVKWDGIRALAYVRDGRLTLHSRNQRDITRTFPELQAIGPFLGSRPALLDGEIVSLGAHGRPEFGRLQHRLQLSDPKEVERRARAAPATFIAFDLLHLDGRALLGLPYDQRRRQLESLEFTGSTFGTTDSFRNVSGADIFRGALENGLEGVVAKRRDAAYYPGQRRPEWRKVKGHRTQEVVIGGWTEGKGNRQGDLGALLLGLPEAGQLRYVGRVGTGFDRDQRTTLLHMLARLAAAQSPFSPALSAAERAAAHFVRPELVGEVQYTEWTPDRRLRHPSWRGLRPDKEPAEVVEEP